MKSLPGPNAERWHAASGYLVVLFGVAGAAFERGSPPANAPVDQLMTFVAIYRRELLAQSVLFVLSAGTYLWFYGALRTVLQRTEGGTGRLSAIAFGAGIVSVALQMVFQGTQVAVAITARDAMEPSVVALSAALMWALSVIAYVPLAVMLGAVSAVSLRYGAFPRWLGWFSALTAIAHLVMALGLAAERGPLAPGGALTYLLYALLLVWLLTITTLMVRRPRDTTGTSR